MSVIPVLQKANWIQSAEHEGLCGRKHHTSLFQYIHILMSTIEECFQSFKATLKHFGDIWLVSRDR